MTAFLARWEKAPLQPSLTECASRAGFRRVEFGPRDGRSESVGRRLRGPDLAGFLRGSMRWAAQPAPRTARGTAFGPQPHPRPNRAAGRSRPRNPGEFGRDIPPSGAPEPERVRPTPEAVARPTARPAGHGPPNAPRVRNRPGRQTALNIQRGSQKDLSEFCFENPRYEAGGARQMSGDL